MIPENVILSPLFTEKTTHQQDSSVYAFKVSKRANKVEVKSAVAKLFNVTPTACRILVVKGKPKRVRYIKGYTPNWKKAYVTLQKGQKITELENV